MKSYLSLIPIQAKVHRKQSRMTRICIFLAVFLVTVIFGMADMEIQSQRIAAIMDGGNWHVAFRDLTEEDAELIGARVEVRESTWYGMLDTDSPACIEGIRAVICGLEESGLDMFPSLQLVEGAFPSGKDQVIATENLKERLGYEIGDQIILQLSEGEEIELQVTGFAEGTAMTDREDRIGLVFDMDGFRTHFSGREDTDSVYYVQLSPFCNMQKAIDDICGQFHLKENQALQYGKLMGLTGQSEDSNMQQLYIAAAVLAVLVIVAGVLMISSSLNSSMSQRTEFFGMLRCLGATRKQVIRFVKREALRWCAAAIPAGLLSGSLAILILVRFLKWISPAYFESMPDFGISVIGLVSGCLVGIVTVLLSSRAPARKASRVSPLQAVSGNASAEMPVKKAANTRFFKVETAMGIHHAKASRKNLILMSGSFALSIVLFLAFSTTLDFMHHAIVPMRPYTPDLYIQSADGTCAIPKDLAGQIVEMDGVKRIFGRSFANHLTARIDGQERDICLVSYEEHQFGWAREMLNEGEADEAEAGNGLLAAYQGEDTLELGKSVSFGEGKEYPVTGILSDSPFTVEEGTLLLICSETVFEEVTGENGYTILDIQLERGRGQRHPQAFGCFLPVFRPEGRKRECKGSLLCHVPVRVWIPGSDHVDHRLPYRKQYLHEHDSQDEAVWSHESHRNERAPDNPDDRGGGFYLWGVRDPGRLYPWHSPQQPSLPSHDHGELGRRMVLACGGYGGDPAGGGSIRVSVCAGTGAKNPNAVRGKYHQCGMKSGSLHMGNVRIFLWGDAIALLEFPVKVG